MLISAQVAEEVLSGRHFGPYNDILTTGSEDAMRTVDDVSQLLAH